ncbi:MAG TPA: site-2 protease family protein [Elusimicrobiales bacterium]|nr:site-2 protease family protein [Elusimicrobiales bacterium]
MEWLIQLPVLFFSIICHEYAHGYVAHKNGDDTAYLMGRLSFNPLPHIDFVGTIVVPFLCKLWGMPMFGWAKPVPVNPLRLHRMREGMTKVSLAGPLSNLLLAVLFAALFKLALLGGGQGLSQPLSIAMRYGVLINLMLAFFNLIPIAPLDGSKILSGLLPLHLAIKYESHARYGMWILLALMLTGAFKFLLLPPLYLALLLLSKIGLGVL